MFVFVLSGYLLCKLKTLLKGNNIDAFNGLTIIKKNVGFLMNSVSIFQVGTLYDNMYVLYVTFIRFIAFNIQKTLLRFISVFSRTTRVNDTKKKLTRTIMIIIIGIYFFITPFVYNNALIPCTACPVQLAYSLYDQIPTYQGFFVKKSLKPVKL